MASTMTHDVPLVQMKDVDVDPAMFDPIRTGNDTVDNFISNRGGFLPSTVIMATGDPGAGKTTMLCEWLADAHINGGARVLFISSEMDHIDFADYANRIPKFDEITTYFVDYERDIKSDLETIFDMGWDIILIDSFKDLKDKVADQTGGRKSDAELFLTNLMKKAKAGIEDGGETYYATTIFIQQVLKSGDAAGSKSLQHLVTAHLKLTVDGTDSYVWFEKNRRGEVRKRLYYEIDEGGLTYDEKRMEREEEALDFMDEENERQQNAQETFASIDDLVNEIADQAMEDEAERHEAVAKILSEEGGNLAATLRRVKAEGLFPQDFSRYKLERFVDENDLQRQTYNT